MDDPKRGEEDKELEIDERDVTDIDVADEDAEATKGGMMADARPTTAFPCKPSQAGCR
jgi:hypothetical protein